MTLPCARAGDLCRCPHGAGPVRSDASVRVNGLAIARLRDPAGCDACRDQVAVGCGTVRAGGRLVARQPDRTLCGCISAGSPNVRVGGPSSAREARILGRAFDRLRAECEALAAGRRSGTRSQTYGNCGLETGRAFLNRLRAARGAAPLSEDEIIERARPWAGLEPGDTYGKIDALGLQALLARGGLDTELQHPTTANLRDAVLAGRGVTVWVRPVYWPSLEGPVPALDMTHIVSVIGVELDHDRVVAVYVNDTGLGRCGARVPLDAFRQAMHEKGDAALLVTRESLP